MNKTMSNSVLIVDDDAEIRELIAMYLRDHQFHTIEAGDGETALRQFKAHKPDLVLLDVLMPGMDGFAVCKQMREMSETPIIFLTSKWASEDIVTGLDIGADDYITKPFMPEVLVARVKLHLRRTKPASNEMVRIGDLEIYRDTCEVRYRGTVIPFLAKEFKLFLFLAERPRQVFNSERLYDMLWEFQDGDSRTVMVHISNIRKKLERYAPNVVEIETIKGMGYRLVSLQGRADVPRPPSTRDAIIEAASQLFSESGYEGMTMKEVAKRVGIHPSSIYSFFENKEDLFLHIYRELLNSHRQLAFDTEQFQEGTPIQTRFDGLIRAIMAFQIKESAKMKIFIRMLLMPAGYFEQDAKAELNKLEQVEKKVFTEMFQEGMDRGEIPQGDSEQLAMLLLCMMDGFFWALQRYDEQAFMERFDKIWEQFWRLIQQ